MAHKNVQLYCYNQGCGGIFNILFLNSKFPAECASNIILVIGQYFVSCFFSSLHVCYVQSNRPIVSVASRTKRGMGMMGFAEKYPLKYSPAYFALWATSNQIEKSLSPFSVFFHTDLVRAFCVTIFSSYCYDIRSDDAMMIVPYRC